MLTYENPLVAQTSLSDLVTRLRRRFTTAIMVVLGLSSLLLTLVIVGDEAFDPNSLLWFPPALTTIGAVVLLYWVQQTRNNANLVINVAAVFLVLVTFNPALSDPNSQPVTLYALIVLALIGGALLANRFVFIVVNLGVVLRLIFHVFLVALSTTPEEAFVSGFLAGLLSLFPFLTGYLIRVFVNTLQDTVNEAQRTAELLEASANIGQVMSKLLDSDQLLSRAVDIIRDRFGFYHVQVFLIDDNQAYAYLKASTGEIGEKLLARHHRLPIDNRSVIGRVLRAGEAVIARDTDPGHAYNDLLPDTRSELALPITDGEQIIGALDVQSTRIDAFTTTRVQALQVMANQLAIAIRNAQLFEEQSQSLRENKRLFIESETALREIQRLNRQLTRQAWQDYLRQRHAIEGVTLSGTEFRPGADWSDPMIQASRRRRAISETHNNRRLIAVPIELRGEVVGAIEVEIEMEANDTVTADMLQAVAQRLAISIDNARLFEETQATTAQEQRVGEIVSQYQSADSIDDLLRITLEGLTETLGAEAGAIRLGMLRDTANASTNASNGNRPSNGASSTTNTPNNEVD